MIVIYHFQGHPHCTEYSLLSACSSYSKSPNRYFFIFLLINSRASNSFPQIINGKCGRNCVHTQSKSRLSSSTITILIISSIGDFVFFLLFHFNLPIFFFNNNNRRNLQFRGGGDVPFCSVSVTMYRGSVGKFVVVGVSFCLVYKLLPDTSGEIEKIGKKHFFV